MRFTVQDAGPVDASFEAKPARRLLVFDSNQLADKSSVSSKDRNPGATFDHFLPVEIGGRKWEFQFSARKDVIVDRVDTVLPWMVLGGGLFSSALLFGMFYSLASSRGRAVEIASEITRDLRDSTERLQAVSRRLVDVQETERRQVSRELHDRVGQNLTALSISMDILKTQLAGNGSDALRSRIEDASSLLESTASVIENVMSDLRPPMLDDYGLLPALQWYANDFSDRTGIEVKVYGDERMERLPQASEIALFRIAQEALNNVAKHAHAGHADITLKHSDRQFIMVVLDDGAGLDTSSAPAAKRRQGLGMMTMRERTQAVGGQFEVTGAAGEGTRVVVRIPV
jgi:signal transduction histidine kinase